MTFDPLRIDWLAAAERGRLLKCFEADERRLMIECRLQQVHFGLQQIALRLRDEKARREPDLEPPLLHVEPLARNSRAGAGGLDALGSAVHLTYRLTQGLGNLQLQARDALRRLAALDLCPRQARFLEAAPE